MPVQRIPLVGSLDTRNINAFTSFDTNDKDQQFRGCYFKVVDNQITKSRKAFVQKRPGLKERNTVSSGKPILWIVPAFTLGSVSSDITVLSSTTSFGLLLGTTDILPSELSDCPTGMSVQMFAGVEYLFVTDTDAVFFINEAAASATLTFTADTTSGGPILTNCSNTSRLLVGQKLSGTGIHASARVLTIDSSTQVTMTQNATANGSGVTITRGYMGKIIDAQFPTDPQGDVVEMDGFLFVGTRSGKIYNSAINSITSWTATGYVTPGIYGGPCRTIKKLGNRICYLGENGIEFFYNAGHATGSPLGRSENDAIKIGVDCCAFPKENISAVSTTLIPAVAQLGTNIFFISATTSSKSRIYHLSQSGLDEISTPVVSQLITNTNSFANGGTVLSAFEMDGDLFVYIAIVASWDVIPPIDLWWTKSSGMWTVANFSRALRIADVGAKTNVGARRVIAAEMSNNSTESGKTFILDSNASEAPVYQDDGSAFSMVIQTTKLDLGTNVRKTVSRVDLVGSDIQSSGTATLETCDDDYTTWVTRGTFDMTDINPRVLRCGSHKGGRAYRITHSANTAFRASAIDIHYEVEEEGT